MLSSYNQITKSLLKILDVKGINGLPTLSDYVKKKLYILGYQDLTEKQIRCKQLVVNSGCYVILIDDPEDELGLPNNYINDLDIMVEENPIGVILIKNRIANENLCFDNDFIGYFIKIATAIIKYSKDTTRSGIVFKNYNRLCKMAPKLLVYKIITSYYSSDPKFYENMLSGYSNEARAVIKDFSIEKLFDENYILSIKSAKEDKVSDSND